MRILAWPTTTLLLLCLTCLPICAYCASGTLEWSYPPLADRPTGIQAIVVLGGAVHEPDAPGQPAELGADSLYRCLAAASVYRRGPRCLMIVSGGKVSADQMAPAVADAMGDFLTKLDVNERDLVIENRSRNTYENAVRVAEILAARKIERVLLVTDAIHLKRSVWCFSAQEVDVIPAGVSYSAFGFELSASDFIPKARAAYQMERVAHEWMGIVWYWIRGRF